MLGHDNGDNEWGQEPGTEDFEKDSSKVKGNTENVPEQWPDL